jgi:hypothetical protein
MGYLKLVEWKRRMLPGKDGDKSCPWVSPNDASEAPRKGQNNTVKGYAFHKISCGRRRMARGEGDERLALL